RGRARLHRDRDDREDAAADPRGRAARELAAAGRAARRRGRGDRLPRERRGRGRAGRDPARVRPEHGGQVRAGQGAAAHAGRAPEQVKDLSDVPSFPAIYAAALDPRSRLGGKRGKGGAGGGAETLPSIAYRVRKVRIDAERARDFDHLMGGPATDLVHPGVLHVLAFPVSLALMARRDFPFPLLGLVHLRNQVLQHRPVKVGDLVDVECRVRDLRPHRKGRTFEAVSTILGEDGEIIATDVSTYLVKGGKPSAAEPSGTAPSGAASSSAASSSAASSKAPSSGAVPSGAASSAASAGATGADAATSDGGRSRRDFEPPQPTGRWVL